MHKRKNPHFGGDFFCAKIVNIFFKLYIDSIG